MTKKSFVVLNLLFSSMAFAAGKGGGSIADLGWPALNFIILLSGLLYFVKKPLREMFDKNAEDVTNLYEYADKRDKEAKIKLEMYQKKMENLEGEKAKIVKNAEEEAKAFIKKAEQESQEYLQRLERDSDSKILHEKKTLEDQLKEDLVTEVIAKAKSKISGDSDLNKKATNKLISQI
jgi:F-type H+-transporting ATPase subunit b